MPSKTRDETPIDHSYWRSETVRLLSSLFGGATSVAAFGGWLDFDTHAVKEEDISVVVSFVSEEELAASNIRELRSFLHRMGRETEQGEIGVLIRGRFIGIRSFDDE